MKNYFLLLFSCSLFSLQGQYQINAARLNASLNTLQQFGRNAQGGNDRVAFSSYELDARNYLIQRMEKIGLQVRVDAAGNISAIRPGVNPNAPVVAFGSHIDAVPNGGHYDGNVGSMGGLEVMETLVEQNISTQHPFELLIFTNEEGGVFGSRALAGKIDASALEVVTASGLTNREGVKRLGGAPEKIKSIARSPGALHAFVELHIEQGSTLYEKSIPIGIVEGIVGLKWWDVTITGFANHAGTTPMNNRKDALMAAADFIKMVNRVVKSYPGRQVGTVGRIEAFPGAPNVIPGKVILSLELRDLSADKIKMLYQEIKKEAEKIGETTATVFSFSPIDATSEPALMDTRIRNIITAEASALGYESISLPSGAGHDAQDMALLTPTGMIFVPSVNGISHSPKEFSSPEAIAKGAQVLLNTLLALDKTAL